MHSWDEDATSLWLDRVRPTNASTFTHTLVSILSKLVEISLPLHLLSLPVFLSSISKDKTIASSYKSTHCWRRSRRKRWRKSERSLNFRVNVQVKGALCLVRTGGTFLNFACYWGYNTWVTLQSKIRIRSEEEKKKGSDAGKSLRRLTYIILLECDAFFLFSCLLQLEADVFHSPGLFTLLFFSSHLVSSLLFSSSSLLLRLSSRPV